MAAVLTSGMTRAKASSVPGRMAAKSQAEAYRWSITPSGRMPRSNQARTPRPFWPIRASGAVRRTLAPELHLCVGMASGDFA